MNRGYSLSQQGLSVLLRAAEPVVLFVAVVAVYAQSVSYDFIYDDRQLIIDRPAPRSVAEVLEVFAVGHWKGLPYYRPIARLTMVVQKYLHGDNPAPYHGLNTLFMGSFAVLTWMLLRQPPMAIGRWPALMGGALVAAHPVASCTVYPICSGRESLMPAMFVVAAVTSYLRPGRLWYAAAMGLFAVSLMCKEQAVILPGLFLLADGLGLSPAAPIRRIVVWAKRYLPVGGILLLYFLIRWLVLHESDKIQVVLFDQPARFALSYLYALQTTFVPFVQLVYEPSRDVWVSLWRAGVCSAVVIGIACLAYRYWSVVGRLVLFWLGWFVLTLLPTANILQQEVAFDERYVLLALVALVGLGMLLGSLFWERKSVRFAFILCITVMVTSCGWISHKRGQYFVDEFSFHSQWAYTNPKSDQAHRGLGWALLQQDRLEEAVMHLEESLRLNPRGIPAQINLGNVYMRCGDPAKALPYFVEVMRLQPNHAESHNDLAGVLAALGNADEAFYHYDTALRLNPKLPEAHNNMGVLLVQQGKVDAAAAHFEIAIQIQPNNAEAHNNLANALSSQGKLTRAVEHYQRALSIKPDYLAALRGLEHAQDKLTHQGTSAESY